MPRNAIRFLRTVRNRLIAARIIESASAGLAIGCVLMLPLIIADGLTATFLIIPGVCALAMIALRLHNLPSLHQVAIETDRQLHLDDLLSSTLAFAAHDDFQRAMLEQANFVTGAISPSEILVWRWGMKRFAGVGLLAAFTLSIALLQAAPSVSSANSFSSSTTSASQDATSLVESSFDESAKVIEQKGREEQAHSANGSANATRSETQEKNGATGNADAKSDSNDSLVSPSAALDQQQGDAETNASVDAATLSTQHSALSTGSPATGDHESHRNDIPAEYRDLIHEYFK